ncbi:MAG: hypothetical protein A2136_09065 [Chloroflexi bacterium RBG_16_54_11]|nr:MAG: hypothetical protein A2136_09065 [Chloroflexi bacterium RBG_16_54_11]
MDKGLETHNRFEHLPRNPKTHAEHRREVFWQITLPLVLGLLLVLAAVEAIFFSALQPVTDVSRWAGVSLMWLILPLLFLALLFLVILVGLIYAISMLLRLIPGYAYKAQFYFTLAQDKLRQISDALVEPVLKIDSLVASLRYLRARRFWRRSKTE